MPTRKISEREKLTIFARTASDEQLDEAYEIIAIERRIRQSGSNRSTGRKPGSKKSAKDVPPGPPNPPKPVNDSPQG